MIRKLKRLKNWDKYFLEISQQNVFDDILERKKAFLDSKIRKLKNSKNKDFSEKIFPSFNFCKIRQENVFDDILGRKKVFFRL